MKKEKEINVEEIVKFADELYLDYHPKEEWVYADEFWQLLEEIAEEFPELDWDIFRNQEDWDWWEAFYQIFCWNLNLTKDYFYWICIEQFGSDWSSYKDYLGWVRRYVEETKALLSLKPQLEG